MKTQKDEVEKGKLRECGHLDLLRGVARSQLRVRGQRGVGGEESGWSGVRKRRQKDDQQHQGGPRQSWTVWLGSGPD